MNKVFLTCISLICIIFANIAYSANISVTHNKIPRDYILIEGEIRKGDYEKFVNAILEAGLSTQYVFIASGGGDAIEAMRIGRLIRSLYYSTEVPYYYTNQGKRAYCHAYLPIPSSSCRCESACILIHLAGIGREGDYLGIHRAFVNHEYLKTLSANEAKKYSNQISRTIRLYFDEMGAPKSLLDKMQAIGSTRIEMLSHDYIHNYLTGYSADYQEWILAKCGDSNLLDAQAVAISESILKKGKDKSQKDVEKYRKILDKEVSKILDQEVNILRCELKTLRLEREKQFYSTIKNIVSKLDAQYVPRHSLLEYIKDKFPFDLDQLIGKTNTEASDLLSLIGVPDSITGISKKKNSYDMDRILDRAIKIDLDDGRVYTVSVRFRDLEHNLLYNGHFLTGLSIDSGPEDFENKFGTPFHVSRINLHLRGVNGQLRLFFTTDSADIAATFDEEKKTLTAVSFVGRGVYKTMLDAKEDKIISKALEYLDFF